MPATVDELIATLPTTADGVRVGILFHVWAITGNRYCVVDGWRCEWDPEIGSAYERRIGDGDLLRVCACYSTPEAAEAARKVGG